MASTSSDNLYEKYAEHIANSGHSNIVAEIVCLIKRLKPEELEELEETMRTIIP